MYCFCVVPSLPKLCQPSGQMFLPAEHQFPSALIFMVYLFIQFLGFKVLEAVCSATHNLIWGFHEPAKQRNKWISQWSQWSFTFMQVLRPLNSTAPKIIFAVPSQQLPTSAQTAGDLPPPHLVTKPKESQTFTLLLESPNLNQTPQSVLKNDIYFSLVLFAVVI